VSPLLSRTSSATGSTDCCRVSAIDGSSPDVKYTGPVAECGGQLSGLGAGAVECGGQAAMLSSRGSLAGGGRDDDFLTDVSDSGCSFSSRHLQHIDITPIARHTASPQLHHGQKTVLRCKLNASF